MVNHFSKDDIETHGVGYGGRAVPAVNVKIRWYFPHENTLGLFAQLQAEFPGFDRAFVEALSDTRLEGFWQMACEHAWQNLESDTNGEHNDQPIFGRPVEVFSEGRSAGWACVKGNPAGDDPAEWDDGAVARWGRFAELARSLADDVPYQWLWLIAANVWQPLEDARQAQIAALTAAFGHPPPFTDGDAADLLMGRAS